MEVNIERVCTNILPNMGKETIERPPNLSISRLQTASAFPFVVLEDPQTKYPRKPPTNKRAQFWRGKSKSLLGGGATD